MNIGYNGIFTASKNTLKQTPQRADGTKLSPGFYAFQVDGINYEKKSAQYKAQISNAKKNGTRCFMLFIEKNAWKLLPYYYKKRKRLCFLFFLFCPRLPA